MVEIVKQRIDIERVLQSVRNPAAGAIATFTGTTRNRSNGKPVLSLEYEAYVPMALKMMNRIASEVRSKWKVFGVSIVHRVGRLEIGDASVIIAVSSEHRTEAFEACRYAIDTLKREVPIWKKEFFGDGEVWVGVETHSQTTE